MHKAKIQSLTMQSLFLTLGRVASYPVTFIAPLVFVRYFSQTDFGYYKQLVVLFYILVPAVNLGFSHAILFYVPRYIDDAKLYISKCIYYQIIVGLVLLAICFLFQEEFKIFFPKGPLIVEYLPLITLHSFFWAISNNFEEVLLVEGHTRLAALFDLMSEIGRALFPVIAILFNVNLYWFLLSMVAVGVIRTVVMMLHFLKFKYIYLKFRSKTEPIVAYSLPLGTGILARFCMNYSHLIIVSFLATPEVFAIFSVGCFTLPILGPLLTAVARVGIVRISSLMNENKLSQVADIIYNSNRKMWLMLLPLFGFSLVNSREIIVLLYTETYVQSVDIFNIYLLLIPIMAIHLEHLPRAFGNTKFLLLLNVLSFIFSIPIIYILYQLYAANGAVAGAVVIYFLRQLFLVRMTIIFLNVKLRNIIPFIIIIQSSIVIFLCSILNWLLITYIVFTPFIVLTISTCFYWPTVFALMWASGLINIEEKNLFVAQFMSMGSKLNKFIRYSR